MSTVPTAYELLEAEYQRVLEQFDNSEPSKRDDDDDDQSDERNENWDQFDVDDYYDYSVPCFTIHLPKIIF